MQKIRQIAVFNSSSSVLHYNLEHCILSYFVKNAIVITGNFVLIQITIYKC